jgi:hypothetical protein
MLAQIKQNNNHTLSNKKTHIQFIPSHEKISVYPYASDLSVMMLITALNFTKHLFPDKVPKN